MKLKIKMLLKKIIWYLCGKNEKYYERIASIKTFIKMLIHKKKYERACKRGRIIQLDIRELFLSNGDGGTFERIDTVVRYLTIKKYYAKDPNAFSLYRKMQEERLGNKESAEEWCLRFEHLIKSFDESGYIKDSCLTVGEDLQIHDGSHRTALCLYNNIYVVPCNVIAYRKKVEYGLNWFLDHRFTSEEISEILIQYNELVQKFKEPYYVQIQKHNDSGNEILSDIAKKISENSEKCLYSFNPHSYKYYLKDERIINIECEKLLEMLTKRMLEQNPIVCKNYEENEQVICLAKL